MTTVPPSELYHYTTGDGPPLLLVNAAYQTADSWKTVVNSLRNDFTVIAVDLPNQGKSPVAAQLQTVADYGSALCEFLRYKKLQPNALTCLGLSLGADILLDLRYNRGIEFRCMLTCGATPTGIDAYVMQHVNVQLECLRDYGVTAMARVMLQKAFSPHFYAQYPAMTNFVVRHIKTTFEHRPQALEALLLATRPNPLTRRRVDSGLGHLTFVQGTEDLLYPLSLYENYGPDLGIEITPVKGGHAYAMERPKEACQLIRSAYAASGHRPLDDRS